MTENARPLITEGEIGTLPLDQALAFKAGTPPIRSHLRPYFLDPELVRRSKIAATRPARRLTAARRRQEIPMSEHPDRPVYAATLREELRALGLWELLDDPTLTDVIVNADGMLHTAGQNGIRQGDTAVSPSRLMSCIATIAGIHRRVIDERHPILEVSLPYHSVRVTALVPPVTTGPVLALRIPPRHLLTLDDLEDPRHPRRRGPPSSSPMNTAMAKRSSSPARSAAARPPSHRPSWTTSSKPAPKSASW